MSRIATQQGIAGDHHVRCLGLCCKLGLTQALSALMGHQTQCGRKALRLLDPVEDDRSRTDQQHWRGEPALLFLQMQQQSQCLHRLTQPHVIGQAGADSPAALKGEPGKAIVLIRAKLCGQACWRRQWLHPLRTGEAIHPLSQPSLVGHLIYGQSVRLFGAQADSQRVEQADFPFLALLFPETNGLLDLLRVETYPLPTDLYKG